VNIGALTGGQVLIIAAHAAIAAQPGEGAFDDPATRDGLEVRTRRAIVVLWRTPDDRDLEVFCGACPVAEGPSVGSISPEMVELGIALADAGKHHPAPDGIGEIGRMDLDSQHQAAGVHHQMALAATYLLPTVVAPDPPFSVVRTDWLSMMPAVG
jgi:hypothetical protein